MDAVMFYKRSGGNHMIRSSKRPGLTQKPRNSKKKKRPARHLLYKTITILMLIVCCPVGLIMLWPRKPIRWRGGVKLLLSLCSLVLFFALLAFGLLYDFKDPTAQRVQQKALLALDDVRGFTRRAGEDMRVKWGSFLEEAGGNWRAAARGTNHAVYIIAYSRRR